MHKDYITIWNNCLEHIAKNVSEHSFTTWFTPIRSLALEENVLTVQVPSRFSYEWIEQHYLHILKKAIQEELGIRGRLAYSVPMEKKKKNNQDSSLFQQNATGTNRSQPTTLQKDSSGASSQLKLPNASSNQGNFNKTVEQAKFDFQNPHNTKNKPKSIAPKSFSNPNLQGFQNQPNNQYYTQNRHQNQVQERPIQIETHLNPKLRLSNYVRGECNKLGCSVAYTISRRPGENSFNPLMIFGGTGLGKTHLVNAIGNDILENEPKHRIMYIHAGNFVTQFIDAVRQNSVGEFNDLFLNLDTLIVDDIQAFSEKRKTQDAFFLIFNHLHQLGKQVILTSDTMPSQIKGVQERLLSRFKWGLTINLDMPDFETRREIIRSKMLRDDMHFSDEVIDYIAKNVQSNVRELEGVLISLIAKEAVMQTPVDIKIADKVIKSIVAKAAQEITLDLGQIQQVLSNYFDMPLEVLISKSRKKDIVLARQMAMYFCNKYTDSSLKVIGKYFGKRDHSTVIHARKSVEQKMDNDECYKQMLDEIDQKIKLLLKPKSK